MTDPQPAPAAARPKRRISRILIAVGALLLAIAFAILLISVTAESEPQSVQPGDSVGESPSEATGIDALELLETRLQILSSSADLSEAAREELEDVIEDLTLVQIGRAHV